MPAILRALLLALLCLGDPSARADASVVTVEGQPFGRVALVAGRELMLNGTGVRAVAWFKGYAAALYLAAPAHDAQEILALAGPKRLQMRMLRDVPSADFVKALRDGIADNAPADELPRLAERVDAFDALIRAVGAVRPGDVIDLDLDPSRGLLFSVNGKLRGSPIAGADFYAAVLRGFIGEHPYDKKMRTGLMGRPG